MLLRESGRNSNQSYALAAVTSEKGDAGVAQGPLLRNLVEAVVAGAWTQLTVLRSQAEIELTSQALVDVLAVISGFYAITRIADSTGIPLDEPTRESTAEMRVHAGIDAFQYEVKNQRYR